jgi:Abnormal spindle-like microcephaly-assoc'd, ASPM-SPD-2-Hydin
MKRTSLHTSLLAGLLAVTGCAGNSATHTPPNYTAPSPGPPILTMYNSSVDFGDVAIGTTTTLGATFANTGQSSLTLQLNAVPGAGFTIAGIGQGVTLEPGQFITLAISFAPSASGKVTGVLSLASNTSSSPISFPISGNGVVGSHSTTLSWDASKSTAIGYNIYRTPVSNQSWAKLNSAPILTTTYTDWDVQAGDVYLFAVTAVGAQNDESGFSIATMAAIPQQ